MSNRLIVFELSGEYGHFRKFNTTTSPLTYPIPTRTALTGLLGAVLGVEREIAPGRFLDGIIPVNELFASSICGLAVQLLAPVRKVNIGFNLLDTGNSFFEIKKSGRTQIEFELLKDPRFRVFVHHQEASVFDSLWKKLSNTSHHFTPYLGLSQFTATLTNATQCTMVERSGSGSTIPIKSAVNLSEINAYPPIEFDQNAHYYVETMPLELSRDRVVTRYGEILINADGDIAPVYANHWFETSDFGNILFL
ncbi:type I-B CRISPR-associated protein Cas5b [Siphonobacter sp. SORGH_AS_1065]|uniref:type I-B CRISPR-associated protein Cas5b n=1 Tax=Siphonobacter sp. SORGH_AS_1065 TaxID=3041795 RepID=UPI00277EBA36|nr:type I-B CRISPR-associated protein Cas5b [Siphonobacter sp. SORGH_AS_1065]MDQ1086160.1 CRISPR-associated protein Cas5h [Siphonobacter sp. SORGH_AS_1065]